MRKTALIIWGGVALAACAPLNTYYKPGATVAMVERQTTQCQVDALAQVPVMLQTVRTPPRFIPPRRVCRSDGRCTSRAGYFEPGQTYTVDPSADLRKRVETQCMADAGFAPVSIPQCPAGIATQNEELRKRLDVDHAAQRLSNFFNAAVELMQVMARACGHDHLNQFTLDDLATFDRDMAALSGVSYGGVR